MKFNLLLEDNQDIFNKIEKLEKLIKELKTLKYLDDKIKNHLLDIYDIIICPWLEEYHLFNKETPKDEEQEMIQLLISIIDTISSFKNKINGSI